jgi:hypothetical protein
MSFSPKKRILKRLTAAPLPNFTGQSLIIQSRNFFIRLLSDAPPSKHLIRGDIASKNIDRVSARHLFLFHITVILQKLLLGQKPAPDPNKNFARFHFDVYLFRPKAVHPRPFPQEQFGEFRWIIAAIDKIG